MAEKKFNLLYEPWICTLRDDGYVKELSICDALIHAHEYRKLAGELVTQDVAIMRFLLAMLQTLVYRYDEDGNESLLESKGEALSRWKAIWDRKCFREETILSYAKMWEEKFWLVHPTVPFYQVPEAEIGTEYTAAKLNGQIAESANKKRLFSNRSGEQKQALEFPEATRWLISINGFDDSSVKIKGESKVQTGTGWLGKIGLVYAEGNSLFETLMLNLTLVSGEGDVWEAPKPAWELEAPRAEERVQIPVPDNQAELLTLQSRRILLTEKGNKITGYHNLGGDVWDEKNCFNEQMTAWQENTKKNTAPFWTPCRHSPERQMWREFSSIFCRGKGTRPPGVVEWLALLIRRELISTDSPILLKTAGAAYDNKKCSVIDVFGDYMEFQPVILSEHGKIWLLEIQDAVSLCDYLADCIGLLRKNLNRASGIKQDMGIQAAKEWYYTAIDRAFRKWMYEIGKEDDLSGVPKQREKWQQEALRVARRYGEQMVKKAGLPAMTGHFYKEESKDGKQKKNSEAIYITSFDAWNIFQKQLAICSPKKKKENMCGE